MKIFGIQREEAEIRRINEQLSEQHNSQNQANNQSQCEDLHTTEQVHRTLPSLLVFNIKVI